jgi:thiosulfate reductase cytochrome b subunit
MVLSADAAATGTAIRHPRWVRVSHWIVTASVLTLVFSGFEILMVHPRLYWGEVGNGLTPAWIELPISRNYKHGGWSTPVPFFDTVDGPVSASHTYRIFNENSWGRSLHFLAAWGLLVPGAIYLLIGLFGGHIRAHIWPRAGEVAPRHVWRDVVEHIYFRIPPASGGPQYGVLQKTSYALVIFGAAPLMLLSGLTMAPAFTAAFPALLDIFGGYQSARTIHFLTFVSLALFVCVHVVMVIASGFWRQIRGMTVGG